MKKRLKFPLRFKILVAQLLVVSVVLSLITFTMANLFHVDKTAYIHDLTSTVVQHTAEEANTLLLGYRDRLRLFARVMAGGGLSGREEVLRGLFEEFGDFVMVTRSSGGREEMVYDAAALEGSGVSLAELLRFRKRHPLPAVIRQPYVENSTVSARLPTLTLTIAEPARAGGEAWRASAVIRLSRLEKLRQETRDRAK